MKLNKIILDSFFYQQLETLAVREGFITKDYDGEIIGETRLLKMKKRKAYLKSRLLLYITLFEQIDSEYSYYDLSHLVSEGLIKEQSNLNRDPHESHNPEIKNDIKAQAILEYSERQAIELLDIQRNNLYKWVSNFESNDFVWGEDPKLINKFIDRTMSELLSGNELHDLNLESKHFQTFDQIDSSVYGLKNSIRNTLFHSITQEVPIAFSELGKSIESKQENINQDLKLFDNLYYLAKTNLKDEIIYLPAPKNLAQALKIRNKKEMKRFREVLSIWLNVLKEGNDSAEKKIRKDLHKANKELKKLERWKEYSKSPINFWINSVGGHIPILSNILTAIYTLGGFYENWVEEKYTWMSIIKKE